MRVSETSGTGAALKEDMQQYLARMSRLLDAAQAEHHHAGATSTRAGRSRSQSAAVSPAPYRNRLSDYQLASAGATSPVRNTVKSSQAVLCRDERMAPTSEFKITAESSTRDQWQSPLNTKARLPGKRAATQDGSGKCSPPEDLRTRKHRAARPLPFDGIDASDSEDDIRDVNALLLALKSSRALAEARYGPHSAFSHDDSPCQSVISNGMAASERSTPDNLQTRAARNVAPAPLTSSQHPAPLSAPPSVRLLTERQWNHNGQHPSTIERHPGSGGYQSGGINGGNMGGTLQQGVIRGDDYARQGSPLAEQLSQQVDRAAPHSEGRRSSARSSIQRLSFARDVESSGLAEALRDNTAQLNDANVQASACTLKEISGTLAIRASQKSLESSLEMDPWYMAASSSTPEDLTPRRLLFAESSTAVQSAPANHGLQPPQRVETAREDLHELESTSASVSMSLACRLPAPETFPPLWNTSSPRPLPEVYSEQAGHLRWSDIGPEGMHTGSLLELADVSLLSAAVAGVATSTHVLTANAAMESTLDADEVAIDGISASISAASWIPSPPGLIRNLDTLQGVVPLRVRYGGVRSHRLSLDSELTSTHESPALTDESPIAVLDRALVETLAAVKEPLAEVCTASSEKGGNPAAGIASETPPGSPRSFLQRLLFSGILSRRPEGHTPNRGSANSATITASHPPASMAANTGVELHHHSTSGRLWPSGRHKEPQTPAELISSAATVAVASKAQPLLSTAGLESSSAAGAFYRSASADFGDPQGTVSSSGDTATHHASQVYAGRRWQSECQWARGEVLLPADEGGVPLDIPPLMVPFMVPGIGVELPGVESLADFTASNLQPALKAAADGAESSFEAASLQSVAVSRVPSRTPVLRWGRVPSLPDSSSALESGCSADGSKRAMMPVMDASLPGKSQGCWDGSAPTAITSTASCILSDSNPNVLDDAVSSDSRTSDRGGGSRYGSAMSSACGEAFSSDGSFMITFEIGDACLQATAEPPTQPPVILEIPPENESENLAISSLLVNPLDRIQTIDETSVSAPFSTARSGEIPAVKAEVVVDRSALAPQSVDLNCRGPLSEMPPSMIPTEMTSSPDISPLRRQAGRTLPQPLKEGAIPPLLSESVVNFVPFSTCKAPRRPHSAPAGGRAVSIGGDAVAVFGGVQTPRLSALQRLKFRTAERQAAVLASGPLMQLSRATVSSKRRADKERESADASMEDPLSALLTAAAATHLYAWLQGAAVRLRMRSQGSILLRADIQDSVSFLSELDAQLETAPAADSNLRRQLAQHVRSRKQQLIALIAGPSSGGRAGPQLPGVHPPDADTAAVGPSLGSPGISLPAPPTPQPATISSSEQPTFGEGTSDGPSSQPRPFLRRQSKTPITRKLDWSHVKPRTVSRLEPTFIPATAREAPNRHRQVSQEMNNSNICNELWRSPPVGARVRSTSQSSGVSGGRASVGRGRGSSRHMGRESSDPGQRPNYGSAHFDVDSRNTAASWEPRSDGANSYTCGKSRSGSIAYGSSGGGVLRPAWGSGAPVPDTVPRLLRGSLAGSQSGPSKPTNSASRPVTVTPRSPSRGVHLRIPSTLHASGNSYNFEEGSAVSGEDDAAFITGVPAGPLDDLLGQVNALLNQVHDILN